MEDFFKGLFTHTPGWFFIISSIIILIAIGASAWWIILGAKRFSDSLGKEERLYNLQEQVYKLKSDNKQKKDISLKLLTVLNNSRLFINTINSDNFPESPIYMYIQRVVEGLVADIKTKAGERHRCGFWLIEEEGKNLKLIQGSSGFPDHYIGNRILGVDESVVGRCFRKKELINCPNVKDDHDYKDSGSNYISLMCIPILTIGALTIDGTEPFDENAEAIAELYGSIIETLLKQLYYGDETELARSEVASTTIEMEGD